ncbi:MAG: T9SS type A sorting domain-containing protein [Flavobacteriales bacterium]|nr:T9SS type A sorting domain-containing protein [Flavobacteriales bacterium]
MKNVHSHKHALLRTLPRLALILGIALLTQNVSNAQVTVTYTNSGTFTVPSGVSQVVVECWGGGGRGGSRTSNGRAGGGGGGAYARSTISVVAGNTYTVTVGAGSTSTSAGGDSWFSSATTIRAKGGSSVANNSTSGAAGGSLASSIGTVKYAGGNGANAPGSTGGGGGSSAGTAGGGANGSGQNGGNAPVGGGDGGDGGNAGFLVGSGQVGAAPGGGGGGAEKAFLSTDQGGNGADGLVLITYTPCVGPTVSVTPSSPAICVGEDVILTASGASAGYTWSPGTGLSSTTGAVVTANPSTTTTYTLTGLNTGCSATGTTTVTVGVNPSPGISSSASASTVCEGGPVVLTATLTPPNYSAGGSSGTLNYAIPDNSTTGTSSIINVVGGSGSISAANTISVGVNLVHTYDRDIMLYLVGPGNCGTLELSTDNGGSGDDYTGTVFQTGAGTPITTGSAPFTGTFAPEGSIVGAPNTDIYTLPSGDLDGCPVNGNYTLWVFDGEGADLGTLLNWDITIDGQGTATASFSGPGTIGAVSYSGPNNTTATATVSNIPAGSNSYIATATTGVGCTATASSTVNAIALPYAGVNGTLNVCESSTTASLISALTGSPDGGGSWSGPSAVSGGNYNASTMLPGIYTYTVAPTSPCAVPVSATVTVSETPVADPGTNGTLTVCANGAATSMFAQLGGSPSTGGTWSGPSAVTGGMFDPPTMSPGIYTYTVSNAPCPDASATVTVSENAAPVMACLPNSTVCVLTPAYVLAESTPLLGSYSGTGVSAGEFDPSVAGVGTHTITYTFTDANTCTNTCTFQITVDADTDGDGVCDLDDSCTLTPGQIGSACPAVAGFTIGSLQSDGMGDCVCVGAVCTTDLSLDVTQAGLATSPSWELRDATNNTLVQTGGGQPFTNPGVHSDVTCVPEGKFKLIVTGLPVGASYVLRLADPPFTRLIDNSVDAVAGNTQIAEFTTSPAILSSNGAVQVPIGSAELLYTSCDKYFWQDGEYIVVNEVPAVAAEWIPNGSNAVQSGTTGYDFWFYDPNGTYSFIRQRRHNVSDNFGNVGSSRTCHMKVNNWAAGSRIPDLLALNVRVRAVVNNVPENWGPACRFQRNEALGDCAPTLLFDVPGHFAYSCDVFRDFNASAANRLYARPVAGATKYRFTFTNAELVTPIVREVPTYYLTLGWGTPLAPQLQPGQNYNVTVEAYKGGVYCQAGRSCLVNINNAAQGGQQNNAIDGMSEQASELALWPNPNQGELLNFKLTRIGEHVSTVSFDLYDLSGKRLVQRTIAVSNGQVNTVIDLHGELAAGMYVVNITSGDEVFTDRVVIQP